MLCMLKQLAYIVGLTPFNCGIKFAYIVGLTPFNCGIKFANLNQSDQLDE